MLAETGKFDAARTILEQALESIPTNQSIQRELASVLFRAGHFREAADLLSKLIFQSPKDAELLNDFGNSCAKIEVCKAIDAYRQALQCPNPAYRMEKSGIACARSGDHDGAAHALERYLGMNPYAGNH